MNRPDSPSWTRAKAAGDIAEQAMVRWLRSQNYDVMKTVGQFSPYDLSASARYEIKHDLQAPTTGNVAIEIAYDTAPSGILATAATHWAILVGSEMFIIPTAKLQDIALDGQHRKVVGGDANKSTMKLVPLAILRRLPQVQIIRIGGVH